MGMDLLDRETLDSSEYLCTDDVSSQDTTRFISTTKYITSLRTAVVSTILHTALHAYFPIPFHFIFSPFPPL